MSSSDNINMEFLKPYIKQFTSSESKYPSYPEIYQWMCDDNQTPQDILHFTASLLSYFGIKSDQNLRHVEDSVDILSSSGSFKNFKSNEHRRHLLASVSVLLLKVIVHRDPAVIDGSWESVLDCIMKYSGTLSEIKYCIPKNVIHQSHLDLMQRVLGLRVKCPNPILRLEMVRLLLVLDIFWPTHNYNHHVKRGFIDAILDINLDLVITHRKFVIGASQIRNMLMADSPNMISLVTNQLNENYGNGKELKFLGKLMLFSGKMAHN